MIEVRLRKLIRERDGISKRWLFNAAALLPFRVLTFFSLSSLLWIRITESSDTESDDNSDDDDSSDDATSPFKDSARPRDESLESKKLRKKAVKDAKAEKRKTKLKKHVKKRKEKQSTKKK